LSQLGAGVVSHTKAVWSGSYTQRWLQSQPLWQTGSQVLSAGVWTEHSAKGPKGSLQVEAGVVLFQQRPSWQAKPFGQAPSLLQARPPFSTDEVL
jgi:hypothetical protein